MANDNYRFEQVTWAADAGDIMEVRKKVFVIEQRFDKEILCDTSDGSSYHVIVHDKYAKPIACGRLTPDGKIDKIAVLINHRGEGIGSSILTQLVAIAKSHNIHDLTLNAEKELVRFYDQQSFHIDGPVYMKQGVPHQRMSKKLVNS